MLTHEKIESNVGWLIVLTVLLVSFGGLAEIVPLFFQKSTTTPENELVKPYDALRLAGRDIYIREGCYNCHSQMIRPFRAETERYGHYSVAGEFVYDHPFQWGSKRTGPDLARVGGRYSDQWHRIHLLNPRDVVPESNMPAYYWLDRPLKDPNIGAKMAARIVDYRQKNGGFKKVEDLMNIQGIGEKNFLKLKPMITVTRSSRLDKRNGHQRPAFHLHGAVGDLLRRHRVVGILQSARAGLRRGRDAASGGRPPGSQCGA